MTDPPITAFAVHTPTATPSNICSYYAKAAFGIVCCVFAVFFVFGGLAPISVRRWKLHCARCRLVKVLWKSTQPFPRTVVWYFVANGKKTKNICKIYTHPPHRRLHKVFKVRPGLLQLLCTGFHVALPTVTMHCRKHQRNVTYYQTLSIIVISGADAVW